jgi:hypothetical protein
LPFFLAGSNQRPAEGAGQTKKDPRKLVARSSAPDEGDGETFQFPEDKGGRLLSRLLAPPETLPPVKPQPRPRSTPRTIAQPSLPLPQLLTLPSVLADQARRTLPPQGLLTPEQALDGPDAPQPLPETLQFAVSDRPRLPSVDVEKPVGLAVMAQPLPDRGALADPTLPASRLAVLTAPLPERSTPAPFLRLTLPDPFEHRDTVRLRQPPGIEEMPNTITRVP